MVKIRIITINWKLSKISGNENIYLLTTRTKQELRVDLQKSSGDKAYAKYSAFSLGSESQKYKLTVGEYIGTAGKMLMICISF